MDLPILIILFSLVMTVVWIVFPFIVLKRLKNIERLAEIFVHKHRS